MREGSIDATFHLRCTRRLITRTCLQVFFNKFNVMADVALPQGCIKLRGLNEVLLAVKLGLDCRHSNRRRHLSCRSRILKKITCRSQILKKISSETCSISSLSWIQHTRMMSSSGSEEGGCSGSMCSC